ncbi:MAG: nucleoside triphosphate pyrophosphohydrolase [Alphaproteobacteria bacterium]|nr:nucleoside triphosphate pyrophosphohydrolase [Alphaproteobacteria bacterium]
MSSQPPSSDTPLSRLLAVMAQLRHPSEGCPWDLEQSFATIVPHTIEEAYEVAEAIETADWDALKDELGDLLFQVVFYAQLGREQGLFDFDAIADAIAQKMVRRHPNVFADAKEADAEAQTRAWEGHKEKEKPRTSALDGVAVTLPALSRAAKLQKRAARKGFDWADPAPVIDKMREELAELEAEMDKGGQGRRFEEMGDLLFTCVNLARKLQIDPESALRSANRKFERRFKSVEASGAKTPEAMEAAWEAAKSAE